MARTAVATDDFSVDNLATDYENGPGGYSPMSVSGGNALSSAANVSCGAYHNDTLNNDQYAIVTAAVQGANDIIGCIVRAQTGTGDAYEGVWRSNNDRWEIAVIDGGTRTILEMDTVNYVDASAGDQLILEAEGTTVRLYTVIGGNEVLRIETTDATHSSGLAGMAAAGVGAAADAQITSLEIGNITADATNIDADLATMTFGSPDAGISLDTDIDAGSASLTLSALPVTITRDAAIAATLATMSMSGLTATVLSAVDVPAALATLDMAAHTSAVSTGNSIQASLATLGIAANTAVVSSDRDVQAALATLALTSPAATIDLTADIEAALATMSINPFVALINDEEPVAVVNLHKGFLTFLGRR